MTLGEKQRKFTHYVGRLIIWAYENGFELTLGDAFRDRRQAQANAAAGIGIADSLHSRRLAIDLNLFINGVYMPKSESYSALGEFWKSLDPDCCWGGDFRPLQDGGHFSLTDGGIK